MTTLGRPTKRTPEVEAKLEQAFALGSTVVGACFYAGISKSTYFQWAEADPDFAERMKSLKEKPVLKALQTIANDLDNPLTAKWLLERRHEDFKPKQGLEHSGDLRVTGLTFIAADD